jgi:hypothetical protein
VERLGGGSNEIGGEHAADDEPAVVHVLDPLDLAFETAEGTLESRRRDRASGASTQAVRGELVDVASRRVAARQHDLGPCIGHEVDDEAARLAQQVGAVAVAIHAHAIALRGKRERRVPVDRPDVVVIGVPHGQQHDLPRHAVGDPHERRWRLAMRAPVQPCGGGLDAALQHLQHAGGLNRNGPVGQRAGDESPSRGRIPRRRWQVRPPDDANPSPAD